MSSMKHAVEDYLRTRRALGFQLHSEETLLRSLARFAEARGHRGPLTADLLEDWARASHRPDPYTWSRRLSVARPFARYLRSFDAATQVPARGIFGRVIVAYHRGFSRTTRSRGSCRRPSACSRGTGCDH